METGLEKGWGTMKKYESDESVAGSAERTNAGTVKVPFCASSTQRKAVFTTKPAAEKLNSR